MNSRRIIIIGGGAAGFFAAITSAETNPQAEVTLLEKSSQFLTKVRISGGGRCNVTHACFEPRELAAHYPRGERALIAPFLNFQVSDTVAWFERRQIKLKTEADGRMFPRTDTSETIVACLLQAAAAARVQTLCGQGVDRIASKPGGGFVVTTHDGQARECDLVLLATGGCRAAAMGQLAVSLGHTLKDPVPSLFTFHIQDELLAGLAGISVESAEVSVPGTKLRERGPVLITHWGLSGPVVLRLSAWGARTLHDTSYKFPLLVNWLPHLKNESLDATLQACRAGHPAKLVINVPIPPLPSRLWARLVTTAGIGPETRWSTLSRGDSHALVQQLTRTPLAVVGKSLNKDEFVTCGGIPLAEVDFRTMESRCCPGLYFAGELLDIDGITGGYNFQAAWTTGWIAGRAMAAAPTR